MRMSIRRSLAAAAVLCLLQPHVRAQAPVAGGPLGGSDFEEQMSAPGRGGPPAAGPVRSGSGRGNDSPYSLSRPPAQASGAPPARMGGAHGAHMGGAAQAETVQPPKKKRPRKRRKRRRRPSKKPVKKKSAPKVERKAAVPSTPIAPANP